MRNITCIAWKFASFIVFVGYAFSIDTGSYQYVPPVELPYSAIISIMAIISYCVADIAYRLTPEDDKHRIHI